MSFICSRNRDPTMTIVKILKSTIHLGLFTFSSLSCASSIVVLDTGHMPANPGAKGANGQTEYYFNLRLTTKIAANLTTQNIIVRRTGSDGKTWKLTQRTANTADADLFVSIHHDSMPQDWITRGLNTTLSGYSIFVSAKNVAPQPSQKCAYYVSYELLSQGEHPSLYHSTPIKGENRPLISKKYGVHQFDDLIVLKSAKTKAILIETGVIVNPTEAIRLWSEETSDKLASAISSGIKHCLASTPT